MSIRVATLTHEEGCAAGEPEAWMGATARVPGNVNRRAL